MAKRLLAIVFLTWKASLRYRFFWVMLALLALSVGGLPLIVKDDGSAAGMTQILITYTLSMITVIMGAATLWISAGSLANDIENFHLQMVATKPIAKWQIWLGKWIGVMSMNFILLLVAGGIVFGMVQYRAKKLTWDALEKMEPRPDLDIAMAIFRSGRPLFVENPKTPGEPRIASNPQPLLAELTELMDDRFKDSVAQFQARNRGKEPLLRSAAEMREEIASVEENILRSELLLARDGMRMTPQVERLFLVQGATNAPPSIRAVKLDTWIEETVKQYWPRYVGQELVQKNEWEKSRGIPINKLSRELDSEDIQRATNQITSEVRGYSQILEPGEGIALYFKKPMTWRPGEDGEFAMRFYFEDTQIGYKADTLYPILFRIGPGSRRFAGRQLSFDARTVHEIPMRVSLDSNEEGKTISMFSEDENIMSVALINTSDKKLKVPYLDSRNRVGGDGVEMVYRESGFLVNYLRGLGIVFAWLGALSALGLFAGSFMSFGMCAFACLGLLVAFPSMSLIEEVVEDGTIMQTYTEGKKDTSYIDKLAVPVFKVMVSVVKPIIEYSPIEKLTEGRSITWSELIKAYGYIWGLSGLVLGVLGTLILSNRQLAITSESGGGGADTQFGLDILGFIAVLILALFIYSLAEGYGRLFIWIAVIIPIMYVAAISYYRVMRISNER